MSRDIRSYFAPAASKSSSNAKECKSNDVPGKTNKKRRLVILESDSDDDQIFTPLNSKKKKEASKSEEKKQQKKTPPPPPKEEAKKPVKVSELKDIFGSTPIKQKPQIITKKLEQKQPENEKREKQKSGKKSKRNTSKSSLQWLDSNSDAELEMSMLEVDDKLLEAGSSSKNVSPTKKVTPKKIATPGKVEKTPKKQAETFTTPGKPVNNKTPSSNKMEPEQRKRFNSEAYQRYLQRSGPRNPGSKSVPKGSPTCLQGKTFVLTGVLDSLERDEAVELIQKCGGKVTTSVSKKTSYIIFGEESGTSKLDKATKFGTKQLTEDGLFDLIREKSGDIVDVEASQDSVILETPPKKAKFEVKKISPVKKESKPEKVTTNSPKIKKIKEAVAKIEFTDDTPPTSGLGSSMSSSPASEPSRVVEAGDLLWVDKYKPKQTKNIIGQAGNRSCVKKLTHWLQNWQTFHSKSAKKKLVRPAPWSQNDDGSFYKAALLSGPPGVGKTTTAHLVCQELGYDVIEFNASDTRSKRLLHEEVSELLSSKTIKGFFQKNISVSDTKHALLMDEVDGMAGNEDRGGIQELIQLIKSSMIPVICMCNDRSHPKMRSLSNYCFDLRFNRPRVDQIKGAMMSVCFKENIKISPESLCDIITNSNHDIRQVLHHLSMWSVGDRALTNQQVKIKSEQAKKSLKLGPWDVARQVFSASDHEKMTLNDKTDLFFQDYSLGPLFVQDLYLRCKPHRAKNDKKKILQLISEAADSLTLGDVVERRIRSSNSWGLLPVQAIFSSVIPGHKMEGHVSGQIQFPVWLGKNSKRNRMDRLLQELQVHMRLNITGSKQAVNLDYLSYIANKLTKPLINKGMDGVPDSLQVLQDYNLLREDLDSIAELYQWPGKPELMSKIEPKVKAALTRAYNKEGKVTPYATVVAVKKGTKGSGGRGGGGGEEEDYYEEGEDGTVTSEDEDGTVTSEDEDNVELDGMIKKVKAKPTKPEKTKVQKETESTSKGKQKSKSTKKNK